jgi:DNA-binding CsgD family transcriptional regulator
MNRDGYHNGPQPRRRVRAFLTPRQIQYLEGLIAGRYVGEIAAVYKCSEKNVYQTLQAARERTGSRTNEQLVARWVACWLMR